MLTKSSCFEGLFLGNEKVKGSELNSSGIYRGEFRGGKKEGSGEFEWTNGEYYIGDWRDGQRHGNGVWTNKQGDSYNGEWLRGSSQGNGIYMSEGIELAMQADSTAETFWISRRTAGARRNTLTRTFMRAGSKKGCRKAKASTFGPTGPATKASSAPASETGKDC